MSGEGYRPPPKMNRKMRRALAAVARKAENHGKNLRPILEFTEIEMNGSGLMNPNRGIKGHS